MTEHTARLRRLAQELHERVNAWRLPPVVEALQALRGVQVTVAVTTVAELGDLTRFDPPRALMKFLGLISWKAQVRLCKRYHTLIARGKHANQVVVAIARELIGFMGAIAKEVPVTPYAPVLDDH